MHPANVILFIELVEKIFLLVVTSLVLGAILYVNYTTPSQLQRTLLRSRSSEMLPDVFSATVSQLPLTSISSRLAFVNLTVKGNCCQINTIITTYNSPTSTYSYFFVMLNVQIEYARNFEAFKNKIFNSFLQSGDAINTFYIYIWIN